MSAQDKIVGIIGGMGPAATVDLLQRIIDLTPASDDADHLRILVDNNPKVPSRIGALLEGSGLDPAPALVAMAQGLVASGAELLAMPCNTAHVYYPQLASQVPVPVINLIDVVGEALFREHPDAVRVGLLASSAVQKIDLYGRGLARRSVETVFPQADYQQQVMSLIRAVKAKADGPESQQVLAAAIADLLAQNCDVIVIACTELSVLAGDIGVGADVPVLDAAQILAEEVVRRARAQPQTGL